MKRISAFFLVVMLMSALFVSCGTTPDVTQAAAAAVTIEELDWSIPIEIDGGESVTYTIDQAKAHELTKIYASYRQLHDDTKTVNPQVTTAIFEGVLFQTVLDDIGYPDAKSVTVYHTDTEYYKPFEYDSDIIHSEDTIIAWIQNKTSVIANSDTYVGFAAAQGGVDDLCLSVSKIVIHP